MAKAKRTTESTESVIARMIAEGRIVSNAATPEELLEEKRQGSGSMGSSLSSGIHLGSRASSAQRKSDLRRRSGG